MLGPGHQLEILPTGREVVVISLAANLICPHSCFLFVEPASLPYRVRFARETNTMPQWAGSCWYYLRFCDPSNFNDPIGKTAYQSWMPVDLYVGGAEHAVLHLLYARFWHKVLFDLWVVTHKEPFQKLVHQGMILGEDGEKMSKSRGNVVG